MAEYRKSDTASWDTQEVRRAQEEPPRKHTKRRRRRRMNPILYILLVLLASALLAGVGWLLMSDLCAFNRGPIAEKTVEITADDNMGDVAEKLHQQGLINYKWFFQLFAGITNAEEKIGLGTYTLNTDMDYRALITGMRSTSGNMTAETVRVTIPEGYTVEQIIKLLAKNGVASEADLMEAAKTADFNYSFIDNDSEDISRLEGYLFPDTYEFYVNTKKPASALDKLISTFNSKIDDELLEQAKARGYDLKEIVIIASLIEKETDGTDHGKIASVIYNRLDGEGTRGGTYGMLQIDASLLYALPGHTGAVTNADKEVDSPYNLYKHEGLPPTAIANPGLASIQAALEPEETGYYYYALGKDGRHHFSTTLEEHNNFINSGNYGG
ncbi:MAG: endolytic transglycosylase MltG [Oscillospiraceae bacterium]|nr:endolytic transglycosylase MltG [Oscillospiraceae bacterium]